MQHNVQATQNNPLSAAKKISGVSESRDESTPRPNVAAGAGPMERGGKFFVSPALDQSPIARLFALGYKNASVDCEVANGLTVSRSRLEAKFESANTT